MKKLIALLPVLTVLLTGCSETGSTGQVLRVVLLVLAIPILALGLLRAWNIYTYNRRPAKKGRRKRIRRVDMLTLAMIVVSLLMILWVVALSGYHYGEGPKQTDPTDPPETTDPPEPVSLFVPQKTEKTDPANWGIRWEIFDNGVIQHTYQRQDPIFFGEPDKYFSLPGVAAFRGNNYRNGGTYGTAEVTEEKLNLLWSADSSALENGRWKGSGWTGQPLVVQWPEETKAIMNLYPAKQAKAGLVEVIYATLDGHIYFLDLEDGTPTRDALNLGMCFKGSGSLDPRGYPLLYVGSGDENGEGKRPRMFIISLIDGSILFEYGHEEELSYRRDNDDWCAFDSSPLVDAETDTLIWPGESGLLYTIRLNTSYQPAAGTVSIRPDAPVCTRYLTARSNEKEYWLGYEASANIVERYLYVSENGGLFYCVDLNTMELVWVQDTGDDSNSSPVFQLISETEAYIYTAPSLHWTQDENAQGSIAIFKLDALTGEIVWKRDFQVHTVSGVSGGVQSTGLLGKAGSNIEDLVFYTVARTATVDSGVLVALNAKTGETVWSWNMDYYTWSSPAAIYTPEGKAYLVVCDTYGKATMLDGATGKILSSVNLGGLVEASPVVYENTLVVGTRAKKILGLQVS